MKVPLKKREEEGRRIESNRFSHSLLRPFDPEDPKMFSLLSLFLSISSVIVMPKFFSSFLFLSEE